MNGEGLEVGFGMEELVYCFLVGSGSVGEVVVSLGIVWVSSGSVECIVKLVGDGYVCFVLVFLYCSVVFLLFLGICWLCLGEGGLVFVFGFLLWWGCWVSEGLSDLFFFFGFFIFGKFLKWCFNLMI